MTGPATDRMARPACGFGPVRIGYWILVELGFSALIIGVALSLAASEHGVAKFKATFSEAFVHLGVAQHEMAERFALTGSWDPIGDGAGHESAPTIQIDPKQPIEAAAQDLERRGASPVGGTDRTRILRHGSNYVVLVRYAGWAGTGAMNFRPAVPNVEHPASVILHCRSGDAPKGWIAAPVLVASNLPASHQPSLCRARRESS